jgi:hypothetical protein
MIKINQRKEYDTERCSACFDNMATVVVSFGTEDAERPGMFNGGYMSFGLCGNCAELLKSSLAVPRKNAPCQAGTKRTARSMKMDAAIAKTDKIRRTNMKTVAQIKEILDNAHGSDTWARFSPFPGYPIATQAVIDLAEAAGCYWLLDIIGSYQSNKRIDKDGLQVWKLNVNLDKHTAVVCGYNDEELAIQQKIPYTGFPLEELTLWVCDNVILLPSEW